MSQAPQRLITGYVPKLALTIVGVAAFGILTLVYWIRFFRSGRQRYMLALCISMACMTLGFIIRILMTNNPSSLGIYIGQYMFILLSPCGFLAQSYIILPRLATWLEAEDCLFLKSRVIVRLFVWADVTVFLIQAAGGGMTAIRGDGTSNLPTIGHYVALVGCIAQCASFGLFTLLAIVFALRVRSRQPQKWSNTVSSYTSSTITILKWREDWRTLFWALLWTCLGIFVRCVFRVAEFSQGYDGVLRTVEFWFYLFDTLPLFLAMSVWTVIWPPHTLESVNPWSQGSYEMRSGSKENRTPQSERAVLI